MDHNINQKKGGLCWTWRANIKYSLSYGNDIRWISFLAYSNLFGNKGFEEEEEEDGSQYSDENYIQSWLSLKCTSILIWVAACSSSTVGFISCVLYVNCINLQWQGLFGLGPHLLISSK
jgi:hypothetical protein